MGETYAVFLSGLHLLVDVNGDKIKLLSTNQAWRACKLMKHGA